MNNSGSVDRTVRLWSLGGRYITTLSTFREWGPILPTVPIQKYFETYRLPADIKTIASFTTMKVKLKKIKKRKKTFCLVFIDRCLNVIYTYIQ